MAGLPVSNFLHLSCKLVDLFPEGFVLNGDIVVGGDNIVNFALSGYLAGSHFEV